MKIKFPPACTCDICSSFCKRPCWPTPAEAVKLIEAGFGKSLMQDYWCDQDKGNVYILCPANKGNEGQIAEFWSHTEAGCTFWINGLCKLHDLGLKPLEGRVTHHDNQMCYNRYNNIVRLWDTPTAQSLVEEWKRLYAKDT